MVGFQAKTTSKRCKATFDASREGALSIPGHSLPRDRILARENAWFTCDLCNRLSIGLPCAASHRVCNLRGWRTKKSVEVVPLSQWRGRRHGQHNGRQTQHQWDAQRAVRSFSVIASSIYFFIASTVSKPLRGCLSHHTCPTFRGPSPIASPRVGTFIRYTMNAQHPEDVLGTVGDGQVMPLLR